MTDTIAVRQSPAPDFERLVQHARLTLEVDKGWAEVYTRLADEHDDERLEQFFDEFSEAHTVEAQAAVLGRWSV